MTARHRLRAARVLRWALAIVAVAFIAWVVPLRDRCWDPITPRSTRVAVTRDAAGCLLHLASGPVRIDAAACGRLECEPGVVSTFAHAHVGVLAALLALYAVGTVAWAGRWRALLAFAGIDLPLAQVWRVSMEAQAGGVVLPGGLGGDALRIASVLARPTSGCDRAPAAIVVASVLLDRAVGLAVIAAAAASLGFFFGGLDAGPLAFVLAAIPAALLGGLLVVRNAPIERIGWLVRGRLGKVVEPVLAYVRDRRAPRAIAAAVVLGVVVAGVQLATVRGIVLSLGAVPVQEKWIYVGTAMAFIVAAVPALPGALGTADAAYVFFFAMAGLSTGTALAVSLIYRLFWYLSGVVGAVLYVARPRVRTVPETSA